ncbi:MAG: isoleucine--tRNA ligase [Acidobacteriota bacterium]|nr:MAG: isoleucine--tRNA ligase [Acidobacteriota bacterium]
MGYERPAREHRFADSERELLRFWREEQIFARSLEHNRSGPRFVFYEGPPTANGLPHNGHVLTRVIKDLFPRYRAMRGDDVPRKAGWDTHGLPVEVEVEKQLGIHGKKEIEAYGVEAFTKRCIESVFRYTEQWEKLTERIGFWIDLSDAYVTYHRPYVESVWWALERLFAKNLLYRGRKSVWWWPQGGTALSAAEVGLGYREVDDPEVVVRFASRSRPGVAYLAWTTTPWTLPSNVALAVHPALDYLLVRRRAPDEPEERLIVAATLAEAMLGDAPFEVEQTIRGEQLVGEQFEPLFRYAEPEGGRAYVIIPAEFVGAEQGTGIVHIAPAFGEDDYKIGQEQGLGFLQLLTPEGKFPDEVPDLGGLSFKQADREVVRMLKERGLLFRTGTYRHDYPFCWRASDDPLIQFARPAWFIRTTALIEQAIANNRAIHWLPEHVKEGRFGDFLANNVDWALSRERYWGTPLPIWICERCDTQEAFDRLDAVVERNPDALDHWHQALAEDSSLSPHLVIHKPWIDHVTFACRSCGATMRRVPEVIDAWFDSGCMPFAQFGFPHRGREQFARAFPADFISEAIDQTRGWFYSLLMISTLVFDEQSQRDYGLPDPRPYPHPYKTCIVLGHVCDPEGKKESKSAGNYTPPDLVLEGRFSLAVDAGAAHRSPAPDDAAVLLPAQAKTLGLPDGTTVSVRSLRDETRAAEARIVPGRAGRDSVVLGKNVREAIGVEAGDQVLIEVLDNPPGADAFRWFFYASGPPGNNTRNSLRAIREQQNEFLVRWSNVLSFFLIYASIDGFDPSVGVSVRGPGLPPLAAGKGYREAGERPLMDRWVLSETALTAKRVTEALDDYRVYDAAQALKGFVDALSNWYVRRTRDRFWAPGYEQDKKDAFWTLWEVLVDLSLLAAPFVPFFAEHVWRTLVVGAWGESVTPSVHLAPWPEPPASWIDEELSSSMALAREIVSLGLAARAEQRIRVRQPLRAARVFLAEQQHAVTALAPIIADELNVKQVTFGGDADAFVVWKMQPNFRALGPRYGKLVPAIKRQLASADAAALRRELDERGEVELAVDGQALVLGSDDIAIAVAAREHYAAASSARAVLVIETDIDEPLRLEGRARELINRIQTLRKELDLDYLDRIEVTVEGPADLGDVLDTFGELIARETLSDRLEVAEPAPAATVKQTTIDGEPARLGLTRVAT